MEGWLLGGKEVGMWVFGEMEVEGWVLVGGEVDGLKVSGWKLGRWELSGLELVGWKLAGWEVAGWKLGGQELVGWWWEQGRSHWHSMRIAGWCSPGAQRVFSELRSSSPQPWQVCHHPLPFSLLFLL